jgi:hypothetical protein
VGRVTDIIFLSGFAPPWVRVVGEIFVGYIWWSVDISLVVWGLCFGKVGGVEERSGLNCTLIISSQKGTGHPSEPGFALGFFLGSCLSGEFFLATGLPHLHCLLFGVLGWVSV